MKAAPKNNRRQPHLRTYVFPDISDLNVFSSENFTAIQSSSDMFLDWSWANIICALCAGDSSICDNSTSHPRLEPRIIQPTQHRLDGLALAKVNVLL